MITLPIKKYGLIFRMVEVSDAAFILGLRTDPALSKHLSPVANDLDRQIQWIKDYKVREASGREYYFLYADEQNDPIGVSRLYDIKNNTLTSGSWLSKPGADVMAALKADLFFLTFTFENLQIEQCFIDIRKDNKKMVRFHKMFFTPVNEDEQHIYMVMDKSGYQKKYEFLKSIIDPQITTP